MKKIYLSAILAAGIALSASAQKLEKPIIDKIKGDTVWKTSEERLYTKAGLLSAEVLHVFVEKVTGAYVLHFRLEIVNGVRVFSVGPDNIVNIKFTDNSVLDLKPLNSEKFAKRDYYDNGTKAEAIVYFELSKTDIEILKSKSVSIVRISTNGAGNLDYEIKPKNSDLIKKDLELILTK